MIKSIRTLFILFTALGFFAVSAPPAYAQTNIAVVDIQSLLRDSKAAKNIRSQLEDMRGDYQKEFSKYEKELKDAEQELVKQRSVLSPEAFADRREDFEQQLVDTQKLVQKRKRALDSAFNKALGKLRDEILNIVADVAEKENYDLVMSKQNVVLGKKRIDMTEQVLSRLNKKIKKIKVNPSLDD